LKAGAVHSEEVTLTFSKGASNASGLNQRNARVRMLDQHFPHLVGSWTERAIFPVNQVHSVGANSKLTTCAN
jgi:hypothetical protein